MVSDLQAHQNAYGRDRTESEPDPDRDIELELCALDMEDSDHQEVKSQVSVITEIIRPYIVKRRGVMWGVTKWCFEVCTWIDLLYIF